MSYQKNVFCKGLICYSGNRKVRCINCGVWVCGSCVIVSEEDKKNRCPNCYFKTFNPDWEKINKDVENWLDHKQSNKEVKDGVKA